MVCILYMDDGKQGLQQGKNEQSGRSNDGDNSPRRLEVFDLEDPQVPRPPAPAALVYLKCKIEVEVLLQIRFVDELPEAQRGVLQVQGCHDDPGLAEQLEIIAGLNQVLKKRGVGGEPGGVEQPLLLQDDEVPEENSVLS